MNRSQLLNRVDAEIDKIKTLAREFDAKQPITDEKALKALVDTETHHVLYRLSHEVLESDISLKDYQHAVHRIISTA